MGRLNLSGLRLFVRIPLLGLIIALMAATIAGGCKKETKSQARPPAPVTVMTISPRDTPVTLEFVGQTQSSHQVEIRARVNGFLEKRLYKEGTLVKAGTVMFTMDAKPFQAQLDAARGVLAQQRARLTTARANLARVKPLTEQDALSQKDLDDATGQEQSSAAAVETAGAEVEQARLNLSYTTISTPVTGLSSYARVQGGAYVNQANSLLTYVAQTDPMWVNFSLSENDLLKYRGEQKSGLLRLPKDQAFIVEVVLADGTIFPKKGTITFADAEFNPQTGTFLIRSTIPNPDDRLRPGQFVRARILGAIRPNAVVVPQRAVQQGAKGHFVWVVSKEEKAEPRPIVVGDWVGNDVFVNEGLRTGDRIVVDGGLTLGPGATVAVKPYVPNAKGAPAPAPAKTEATSPDKGEGKNRGRN
ncbi:MAG TPA: efflux RND transporter periplasmic adaptor subunit [Syntrophorhabdaceae bacterium]|jgi:membrane fusion protein (multidrug efflux system)